MATEKTRFFPDAASSVEEKLDALRNVVGKCAAGRLNVKSVERNDIKGHQGWLVRYMENGDDPGF